MHLLPFIRKLVSVLGLVFIITSGWLCYITSTVTGNGMINHSDGSLSHSLSIAGNRDGSSSLVNPDQSGLPDDSDLQELTQGLHPGRGDPIPDAKDVHELPVVDVSFHNNRGNLLSGWLALRSPLHPAIILTHSTPANPLSLPPHAPLLSNTT